MQLSETLIELFESVRERDREIRFIDGQHDESQLSFGDLWQRALRLLGALQRSMRLQHRGIRGPEGSRGVTTRTGGRITSSVRGHSGSSSSSVLTASTRARAAKPVQ